MTLKRLLQMQVAYAIAGILYNVVSYATLSLHGIALAPTAPVTGALVMGAYYLCLLPGAMGYVTVYRILMAAAVVVLGYGGVAKHVMNYFTGLQGYSSTLAWALAIAINLTGLVLNVVGALGLFRKKAD
jgi:hypothetical protein